jgi:deoxycytidine triphosphate deaminase
MRVAEFHGNVTQFEPKWEGFGTLRISNTCMPAKGYANEGLCQIP